jgi:UDP-galactopyranose mutase
MAIYSQQIGWLNKMIYDCIVVGSGICGLTAARKLADAGKKILVAEQSTQIGGLCKESYFRGTRFSLFGPHIFHTDDDEVWKFLSRFTDWTLFNSLYYVKSYCKGKLWTIPIDYNELGEHSEWQELLLKSYLYEDYNRKMWGDHVDEIAINSLKRLNMSSPLDKRYFKDKYQAFPTSGYNVMFSNMVDIATMSVMTGAVFKMDECCDDTPIIYTGRIDKLIEINSLPFMTMGFELKVDGDFPWSDKWGCINFPQDYDFIRVHSSKVLYQQDTKYDVVVYEYPRLSGPECYPLRYKETSITYDFVVKELKEKYPNVIPAGRAGKFEYMNMDQAVRDGLDAANKVLKGNK